MSPLPLTNGTFTIRDTVFQHTEDTESIPNPSDELVWGFVSRTPELQVTHPGQSGFKAGTSTYLVQCQGVTSAGERCAQLYNWTIDNPNPMTDPDRHETWKAVAGAVMECIADDGCENTMIIPSPTFIPGSAHRITENLITGLNPSEKSIATAEAADTEALKA
jgi:hypothetical protein